MLKRLRSLLICRIFAEMLHEGTVVKSIGNTYVVRDRAGAMHDCIVRGKFRIREGLKATNPVAIGDEVQFAPSPDSAQPGQIHELLDRRNYLLRKAILQKHHVHILCANIDQVLILFTLQEPRTSLGFVDRLLVIAEGYHIPARIILNKTDIAEAAGRSEELAEIEALYTGLGYEVHRICANADQYATEVQALLNNQVSFLCGHSGAGKSTLVNLVSPGLTLRTQEVSDYHKKGRHTTTHSEMFPLAVGGYVIDAPGIKEIGLAHFEAAEIGHYFPEIRDRMDGCRFADCQHTNEPHCAVIKAVEAGEIHPSRYRSYLGMLADAEE